MEDVTIKAFLDVTVGYGSGNGNGYGYGSGYGYGNGSGYGRGNGNGLLNISRFNDENVYNVDDVPTVIRHVRGNVAKGAILNGDFTLTECYIVKHNNLFAHGETLRKAKEALSEKIFADMDTEERIDAFLNEFTDMDKAYDNSVFFSWHNKLTGSCEMGRKQFAAAFPSRAQETLNREISAFPPFGETVKRLAEYEDLEEQGRLVKLPCKVGDTVYCIRIRKRNGHYTDTAVEKTVQGIEIGRGNHICFRFGTTDWESVNRVFLTLQEAEAALANKNK